MRQIGVRLSDLLGDRLGRQLRSGGSVELAQDRIVLVHDAHQRVIVFRLLLDGQRAAVRLGGQRVGIAPEIPGKTRLETRLCFAASLREENFFIKSIVLFSLKKLFIIFNATKIHFKVV